MGEVIEGYATRKQLAAAMDVCCATIRRHEALGLPNIKIAGMTFYNLEKVGAWMHDRKTAKAA